MGYYQRGDYYRGDYYRGDPFVGGLVGGLVAKAGKWALGKIGKATVGGIIGTAATGATVASLMPKVNIGPLKIDPGSMLPGGKPGIRWGFAKRRRINPLNPKALKRALRRAEGFETFAKRTVNALYKTVDGRRVHTFKKTTAKRK